MRPGYVTAECFLCGTRAAQRTVSYVLAVGQGLDRKPTCSRAGQFPVAGPGLTLPMG